MMVAFTVKLTKPWTPEIFLECYCVAKRKPIRHEKSRPQTATIVSLWFLWFAHMSWTLLWMVTTQSILLKIFSHSWFSEFDSNSNSNNNNNNNNNSDNNNIFEMFSLRGKISTQPSVFAPVKMPI